jgi:hypothetical protein
MFLQTFFALLGIIVAIILGVATIYLMIYLANRAENRIRRWPAAVRFGLSLPKMVLYAISGYIRAHLPRTSRRQEIPPLSEVVVEMAERPMGTTITPPAPVLLLQSRATTPGQAVEEAGVPSRGRYADSVARPARPVQGLLPQDTNLPLLSPQRSTTM